MNIFKWLFVDEPLQVVPLHRDRRVEALGWPVERRKGDRRDQSELGRVWREQTEHDLDEVIKRFAKH